MGQHHGRVFHILALQPVAKIADARAGIEDDPRAAARDFDTARIATDGNMVWRGAGDAPSNTPELDFETR